MLLKIRKLSVVTPLLATGLMLGCASEEAAEVMPEPTLAAPQYAPPAGAPAALAAPRPAYAPPPTSTAQHPYSYLAPQAASAYPRAWYPSASPRKWKWIVVHHSDTKVGSAAVFDRYHRQVRHWESLGYDFVIGNGSESKDGLVEVGPRWTHQQMGAHAGVLEYNDQGIGICLVGDFQQSAPTAAQMKSLTQLCGFLMKQYHIPAAGIIGHRDFRSTNCPGKYMNLASLRSAAARYASAEKNNVLDELPVQPMEEVVASSGELMHDVR